MKLKTIAALAALSLGAVAAQATTANLGTLSPTISSSGGVATSFGGVVNDNFTFSLSVNSIVQSNVTTFLGNLNPAFYGIYTAGADSIVGNADDQLVVGHGFTSVSTSHFDTVTAGSYYFKVFGLSNSALSAYSISATATAAPVPEPETYALLGAGLGIVGFVASRRRRDY
ncbi:FxDxF family PEP-CTERM protein [Roseateles sp. BYS78W]|uniref:FxDxF family PEP-CTERM protein n=1 Tax=Pelomonas candidula TaxID=3299025 RepID=A0ABW7H7U3_9BURK